MSAEIEIPQLDKKRQSDAIAHVQEAIAAQRLAPSPQKERVVNSDHRALPTCPCCGQRLILREELVLPPIKRRVFDAVRRHPGIDAETLRGLVWAADPNGGPEDRKVLHVHIHQLNRMLQLHGLRVRGSTSGGYRIVSTEEIAP